MARYLSKPEHPPVCHQTWLVNPQHMEFNEHPKIYPLIKYSTITAKHLDLPALFGGHLPTC